MITVSRDEEERRAVRSTVDAIAHEIFEYADERVGHAENVPKEQLMLACYHRLGELLAEWAKKLDKLEKVSDEPNWLRAYFAKKESQGRKSVVIDSISLGFPVDGLFFAKEKGQEKNLSDDLILVSEPVSMVKEDFSDLIKFCEDNGLDFYVDGFNARQPGRSFRVSVYSPKISSKSRLELREKSILALGIFKELSSTSTGVVAVERKVFINKLVGSGKFDELLASKVTELLIASGQIPKSMLI
jgi:hypothetical protein